MLLSLIHRAVFLAGLTWLLIQGSVLAFDVGGTYSAGPSTAGFLYLPTGAEQRDSGAAVLLVHDRLGLDRRSQGYITQLTAAGLVVLDLEVSGSSADGAFIEPLEGRAAATAVAEAAAFLARQPGVNPKRIGAIGFGSGAQAVTLAVPASEVESDLLAARVLLYPGCAALTQLLQGDQMASGRPISPLLLLHGDADPANPPAACAQLAAVLGETTPVRRITYRQAGYAWDRPPVGRDETTGLAPPEAGDTIAKGRLLIRHWPELAEMSAAQATGFLALALRGTAP